MATVSPAKVNPDYEVRPSEDIGTFFIDGMNSFDSRRFGPSWRVFCTDIKDASTGEVGERFIWLCKRNATRDAEFENMQAEINRGNRIGPCVLESRGLDDGNKTWLVKEAPPPPPRASVEPRTRAANAEKAPEGVPAT